MSTCTEKVNKRWPAIAIVIPTRCICARGAYRDFCVEAQKMQYGKNRPAVGGG